MYTSINLSTSIDSRKHHANQFHPSKKTPHIATHPSSPPRTPGNYPDFLSFTVVSSLWDCHINGIIQYVTFCKWPLSFRVMSLGFIQGAARVHIWSFLLLSSIPSFSCATVCLSIHPWLVFRVSWAFVKGILVLSFLLWSVSSHSVQPACLLPLPSPALSVPFPFPLSSHWAKGHTCPGSETSQSRRARGRCG